MSINKPTGGQAYPQHTKYLAANGAVQSEGPQGGMTLRDYFAAKAMQGLVTVGITEQNTDLYKRNEKGECSISLTAYYLADEMLEARK